ncbi:S1 RNA-binding domain-containing protein [Sulfurovum sp. bin170]|uniref:helix-hairpin-helix domain-containing protein n=1 Tax=Sulfurovum sp. bin170 TaxID=2695268 RepID=UPI0013E03627|nr:Tex-like N-terminal domain-containing protein [Sulfurovum sp. bin170]NEW61749.1 S1 RNA-binding domain-containing protein [Sulfurovum sp. bin170]
MQNLINLLTQKTALNRNQITNILKLLDEGSTIPFIARYRKEMTGGASDDLLRDFHEVYLSAKRLLERKGEIVKLLIEREHMTTELQKAIDGANTMTTLEDIYRPYKEKRNSRASMAIKNGLEPLANILQSAKMDKREFETKAKLFVEGAVESVNDAINGAKDIVAERFADSAKERNILRDMTLKHGMIEVKAGKKFDERGVYKNYKSHSERVAYVPSHRYLAVRRGEKEKELSVKISIDSERYLETLKRYKLRDYMGSSKSILFEAYRDGFKRLLYPSIEREVSALLKERADLSAIGVFGKNLSQLFMTPPVTNKVLLGADPAYKTGCKLVVIDKNGTYLDDALIFPTPPKSDFEGSRKVVLDLVKRHGIDGVVIGNGTASKETQEFFAKINKELKGELKYTVVSEAGASVYSASKVGAEEYPNLDVTVRGAISIAGRVRDPMATLVKIDPKSLGIGQYQHDVDQKLLERKLQEGVESLVNGVGVDVNSASASLLAFVAGVGSKLAKNIVEYRKANGAFRSKKELLKVKGLGAKAYQQLAGFIRIREGESIFDNTGIHPESYAVASKLEKFSDVSDTKALAEKLGVGEATLKDIIKELAKPGFDPREELESIPFKDDLTDISMLREGSIVSGVVRNIADFGAFVDIGLKNDGMIHISQMSQKRISHPLEVLSVNQYLARIEVISIDLEKGKVGLSLKSI